MFVDLKAPFEGESLKRSRGQRDYRSLSQPCTGINLPGSPLSLWRQLKVALFVCVCVGGDVRIKKFEFGFYGG